jgi:hypothetical protein
VRSIALLGIALVCTTAATAGDGGRVVAAEGVRVVVPAGWQRVHAARPGSVTDPRTVLVVGTNGSRPKSSGCQIASYRVPVDGAVVVVVGWKHLALSGAQGAEPGREPLAALTAVRRPAFECFGGRGAATQVVLAGKAFQVNVLAGDHASRRRVAEALAVARSFDLAR